MVFSAETISHHPKLFTATALFGGILGLDYVTGLNNGHERSSAITFLDTCIDDTKPLAVVFGGLGHEKGDAIANALAPWLGNIANLGYVNYEHNDIGLSQITEQIASIMAGLEAPNTIFYGHSMGGLVALDVAKSLEQSAGCIDIFLDCTPFDDICVRANQDPKSRLLLQILNHLPYSPGLLSRTLAMLGKEAFERQHTDGSNFYPHSVKQLAEVAIHGPSYQLLRKQYRHISGKVPVIGNANVYYIHPTDPLGDPVVDVQQSLEKFANIYPNIMPVKIKGSGHASPVRHPSAYIAKLLDVL
jgi:pimeloyl-ACP methyl ester carboxylesterase